MSETGYGGNTGAGGVVTGMATLFAGVGTIINHGAVHDGVAQEITEPGIEKVVQAFVWGLEFGTALGIVVVFAVIMTFLTMQ